MSWFLEKDNRTSVQKLFGQILSFGSVPNHVAIIMDGNRRYAKQNKVEQKKGHDQGFSKLTDVLSWCNHLNIKEITVYAFSIENFKRPKEEVDQLFNLARTKFQKLLDEKNTLIELDLCINFLGNLSLLPADMQKTMGEIIELTKDHKTYFLNICCAYTSREEMTNACKEICNGILEGVLTINDINEDLIDKCMYTNKSSKVDLLIRTSGEVRLSDFLLWQCNESTLVFESRLWPEFTVWDLYSAILKYQLNTKAKSKAEMSIKNAKPSIVNDHDHDQRVSDFVSNINSNRNENIKSMLLKE